MKFEDVSPAHLKISQQSSRRAISVFISPLENGIMYYLVLVGYLIYLFLALFIHRKAHTQSPRGKVLHRMWSLLTPGGGFELSWPPLPKERNLKRRRILSRVENEGMIESWPSDWKRSQRNKVFKADRIRFQRLKLGSPSLVQNYRYKSLKDRWRRTPSII